MSWLRFRGAARTVARLASGTKVAERVTLIGPAFNRDGDIFLRDGDTPALERRAVIERVKTTEVRQRLGDLLDRVADRSEQFVIERRGKPMAALVPFESYERLQKAAEVELMSVLERDARRLTRKQATDLARRVKYRSG